MSQQFLSSFIFLPSLSTDWVGRSHSVPSSSFSHWPIGSTKGADFGSASGTDFDFGSASGTDFDFGSTSGAGVGSTSPGTAGAGAGSTSPGTTGTGAWILGWSRESFQSLLGVPGLTTRSKDATRGFLRVFFEARMEVLAPQMDGG